MPHFLWSALRVHSAFLLSYALVLRLLAAEASVATIVPAKPTNEAAIRSFIRALFIGILSEYSFTKRDKVPIHNGLATYIVSGSTPCGQQ